MAKRFVDYRPDERPDVEVLVESIWCPGELRMWVHDGERWTADVQYRAPGTFSSMLGTFTAAQVREDTVDRSYGRT